MMKPIADWLQQQYTLSAPLEVSLLRSYTNAVYQVLSSSGKYVLKVYGVAWRSEGEIRYEVDLLETLDRAGLAIARPIRGRDGAAVKPIRTARGQQLAVLFEFADGVKPQPPFSQRLYFLFGEAIGRLHELSTNFTSAYPRQPVDLAYLIDQPLQLLLPLLEQQPGSAVDFQRLAQRIKQQLETLRPKGLDWGPVHGDASLDNLHLVNDDHVILYDFDSGGPGWRASDLQGWAIGFPQYQERYTAFLNGYRQVRPVHAQDIQASWYLTLAWDIWGMKVDLERRILQLGQASLDQYLATQLEQLREREKSLP
jgi:Ser/Thr protein kinase RdoA (MazF antagonist)